MKKKTTLGVMLLFFLAVQPAWALINVGILYSDSSGAPLDLQQILLNSSLIETVEVLDINSTVPLLDALSLFDVMVVHINDSLTDPTGVGNVLADYLDLGQKGLVLGAMAFVSTHSIGGRLAADGYLPFLNGDLETTVLTADSLPNHPVFWQVNSLEENIHHRGLPAPGAEALGFFADGVTYLAAQKGSVLALNFYYAQPASIYLKADEWQMLIDAVRTVGGAMTAPWEKVAETPVAAMHGDLVGDGRFLYLIGGQDPIDWEMLDSVLRYDPATDHWTTVASLPEPLAGSNGVYHQGKIYLAGGGDGYSYNTCTMYIYDIENDVWSAGASCGEDRGTDGYVLLRQGESLYRIGGFNAETVEIVDWNFRYDIATDTWTELTPAPTVRWSPVAAVFGGQIYMAGGNYELAVPGDTCEVYDIESDQWLAEGCAPPPLPIAAAGFAQWNGRLYVAGGEQGTHLLPLAEAWMYDPVQDLWILRTEYPANYLSWNDAAVVGGALYATAGIWEPYDYFQRMEICQADATIACGETVTGTTVAARDYYNHYFCDETRDESGAEKSYALSLSSPTYLKAVLTPSGLADLDVYLLRDCDPSACAQFGDDSLVAALDRGDYRLTVDGLEGASGDYSLRLICCDGCIIDDVCLDNSQTNPLNPCQECNPAIARDSWSHRADGTACNDGLFCTGSDSCLSGECLTHEGDPCPAPGICNEDQDRCDSVDDDDNDNDDNNDDNNDNDDDDKNDTPKPSDTNDDPDSNDDKGCGL